jgi:hypothetical protein
MVPGVFSVTMNLGSHTGVAFHLRQHFLRLDYPVYCHHVVHGTELFSYV